ncbi:MAG TPA: methionine--tRNA ligase [Actinomycetota bacterium]|nr:methionine--tRNA ligase [Actinomycetota bacterium]
MGRETDLGQSTSEGSMGNGTFYLTTPIYYVNDVPHLGHAYTTVAADLICRWHRLEGLDVHFLTGTDEHGQKIARTAEAQGVSPKEWTDSILPRWIEVWKALDISNDDFIRTTEPRHEEPVKKFVQELYDREHIYLGTYEGLYCVGCEAFKLPDELVDGKCPDHGVAPEVVKEDNYFFRLSAFADRLIDLYENDERFVMPEARRNEVLGKVKSGLDDLSISRVSLDWGIPLPWAPEHVIYVWVDALQNYITAIGYGSEDGDFERYWPADAHLVGKDILWFHSVIWPAMLMALDLPLPRTVFAHGFLQIGGEKMSKSKLTGISPHDLIETFGSDGYRYYFMREISFGLDGSFSWESMVARYNSDLANDLGNLASRVLSMFGRYLDGAVPPAPSDDELTDAEHRLREVYTIAFSAMSENIRDFAVHDALKAAWSFVRKANAYVEEVAPWVIAKDPEARRRLEVVLYSLADSLRLLSLITWPVVPRAATELWARLGMDSAIDNARFDIDGTWGRLLEGAQVRQGDPLFPRLEDV